jgi:vancomycin permeability regulator SanA
MKLIKKLLITAAVIFSVSYAAAFFFIALYPAQNEMMDSKYLCVVFGAGITKSSEPSRALQSRLDKAIELYNEQRIIKIFVSGKEPEAYVMRNYLYRHGVLPDHIIMDPLGENTYSTVINVEKYMRENSIENVVFVSQKYHLPRIILIVTKRNFSRPLYIAADWKRIDRDEQFFFITRESMAYLRTLVIGH